MPVEEVKTERELRAWVERTDPACYIMWGSDLGTLVALGHYREGRAFAEYWFAYAGDFRKVGGLTEISVGGPGRSDQWDEALRANAPEREYDLAADPYGFGRGA